MLSIIPFYIIRGINISVFEIGLNNLRLFFLSSFISYYEVLTKFDILLLFTVCALVAALLIFGQLVIQVITVNNSAIRLHKHLHTTYLGNSLMI